MNDPVAAAPVPTGSRQISAAEQQRFALQAAAEARLGWGSIEMAASSEVLVGANAGSSWAYETVTSGRWKVRLACVGTGILTVYSGPPSVLARLARPATAPPDRHGPEHLSTDCGRVVTFTTGQAGPDGLEIQATLAHAEPMTGIAWRRVG